MTKKVIESVLLIFRMVEKNSPEIKVTDQFSNQTLKKIVDYFASPFLRRHLQSKVRRSGSVTIMIDPNTIIQLGQEELGILNRMGKLEEVSKENKGRGISRRG